jgi:hypothetical protein
MVGLARYESADHLLQQNIHRLLAPEFCLLSGPHPY